MHQNKITTEVEIGGDIRFFSVSFEDPNHLRMALDIIRDSILTSFHELDDLSEVKIDS